MKEASIPVNNFFLKNYQKIDLLILKATFKERFNFFNLQRHNVAQIVGQFACQSYQKKCNEISFKFLYVLFQVFLFILFISVPFDYRQIMVIQ